MNYFNESLFEKAGRDVIENIIGKNIRKSYPLKPHYDNPSTSFKMTSSGTMKKGEKFVFVMFCHILPLILLIFGFLPSN